MTGVRLVVVEDWRPAPRRPLVLEAGDVVRVGEHDTEWTSYLWCTGPDGTGGWIPQDYLVEREDGTATITVGYSTVELPVRSGDVVSGFQTAGAWTWCVAEDGAAGWLPNRILGTPQRS
jgi:hypothetical protein